MKASFQLEQHTNMEKNNNNINIVQQKPEIANLNLVLW